MSVFTDVPPALVPMRTRSAPPLRRITVGIAEAAVSADRNALIVTHALGSCLGISLYDPVERVGGIYHPLLPSSSVSMEKAAKTPLACVDTGFPLFLELFAKQGGRRDRAILKVAGGNCMYGTEISDFFGIGRRNIAALRKELWKTGILIKGEKVGGTQPQTMSIVIADGDVNVVTAGVVSPL